MDRKSGILLSEEKQQIHIGNLRVEMVYSINQKKMNECMLNILKQKMER